MSRYRKGTLDHDGDGKAGGSMKGSKMTKKKAKKPAAKEPDLDHASYRRGRAARKRLIDRNSVTPGADKRSWQAGWDYQDKI